MNLKLGKSILFREKIFPNLPATTSGICFARSAAAACSLEDPYFRLEFAPYNKIARGGDYTARIKSRNKYTIMVAKDYFATDLVRKAWQDLSTKLGSNLDRLNTLN